RRSAAPHRGQRGGGSARAGAGSRRRPRSARLDDHQRTGGAELPHRRHLRGTGLPQPRPDPHRREGRAARPLQHRSRHHPVRERPVPARGGRPLMEGAWARRPATAVSRLKGRALLVLSARDLLEAAAQSDEVLVALVAPAAAAMAGFARAARDADAPLLLVRPSGASEETGPEEARDDTAFVEAAFKAADEVRFAGPMALLKEPPRAGSSVSDSVRVQREIDTGFTGVALAAADSQQEVRDAALAATAVCQRELGLEVVPLGGAMAAAELARQLRSRGAPPSAVRLTGMEDQAADL